MCQRTADHDPLVRGRRYENEPGSLRLVGVRSPLVGQAELGIVTDTATRDLVALLTRFMQVGCFILTYTKLVTHHCRKVHVVCACVIHGHVTDIHRSIFP